MTGTQIGASVVLATAARQESAPSMSSCSSCVTPWAPAAAIHSAARVSTAAPRFARATAAASPSISVTFLVAAASSAFLAAGVFSDFLAFLAAGSYQAARAQEPITAAHSYHAFCGRAFPGLHATANMQRAADNVRRTKSARAHIRPPLHAHAHAEEVC